MPEIKIKEWQGEPIGDLPEQKVREHFGLGPDDKAYLVYIDNKLVYFQYIVPFVSGNQKLNSDNIKAAMAEHKKRLLSRMGGG